METHKFVEIRFPFNGSILKDASFGKLNSNPIDIETAPVTENMTSMVGTRPTVAPGAGAGRGGSGNYFLSDSGQMDTIEIVLTHRPSHRRIWEWDRNIIGACPTESHIEFKVSSEIREVKVHLYIEGVLYQRHRIFKKFLGSCDGVLEHRVVE